jgi:hypothetical protein
MYECYIVVSFLQSNLRQFLKILLTGFSISVLVFHLHAIELHRALFVYGA